MIEHIGNYKDLNGDTVRVTFENRRYYYETVDGTPDRYVSHQGGRYRPNAGAGLMTCPVCNATITSWHEEDLIEQKGYCADCEVQAGTGHCTGHEHRLT